DLFRQLLNVRVCDAEMKDASFPIFEIIFRPDVLGKFEQLDPDLVDRRQVTDTKARPIGTEHVRTHLADGAVVLGDGCGRHDRIKTQNLCVPLEGGINIRNRQTDVTERARISHIGLSVPDVDARSEEHTSELQSLTNLVCRLLLEKKKKYTYHI